MMLPVKPAPAIMKSFIDMLGFNVYNSHALETFFLRICSRDPTVNEYVCIFLGLAL